MNELKPCPCFSGETWLCFGDDKSSQTVMCKYGIRLDTKEAFDEVFDNFFENVKSRQDVNND